MDEEKWTIATCPSSRTGPLVDWMAMEGIEVVAPSFYVLERVGSSRKRVRRKRFVLPGFLFFDRRHEETIRSFQDEKPVWVLMTPLGKIARCSDKELRPVQEYARGIEERPASPAEGSAQSERFAVGDRVTVRDGPFAGCSGRVLGLRREGLVSVELEQFSTEVNFRPFFLERLELKEKGASI